MDSFAFIERSRLGKVFYLISDSRLSISGSRALRKFSLEVELTNIADRVERHSRRFIKPQIRLFGYSAVFAILIILFLIQKSLPLIAVSYFVETAGILLVIFFGAGLKWIPKLEVVRIKDILGRTLFDVVKEQAYKDDFEAFVRTLRDRVAKAKDPSKLMASQQESQPKPEQPQAEFAWIVSLVCGVIALIGPWIVRFTFPHSEWVFPVTFCCSVGGVGFCVYSFAGSEKWRFLSLLGALVSLVPAFKY